MLLYQIVVCTKHRKIWKKSYKNNKNKISAPTCNERSYLPDGLNSVSDNQCYFEYILKKGENTAITSIKIHIHKIENWIIFKIKTGYYLKLLMPKIIKLLGSTKKKINKNKNKGAKRSSFRNHWVSISSL